MYILYVEDERFLAEAVVHLLRKAGMVVDWAADGHEGLALAERNAYDCVILDIMLPEISGLEILQTLRRKENHVPIIMLSALSAVDDKVKALDFGADDYLAKPFKVAELIARIQALLRRPPLKTATLLTFGDLAYDLENRTLNGVALTRKEAALAEALLNSPSRIQTKPQLLARIWGESAAHNENYVEVYMRHLRKKLAALNSCVEIETVRNLGYRLRENHKIAKSSTESPAPQIPPIVNGESS